MLVIYYKGYLLIEMYIGCIISVVKIYKEGWQAGGHMCSQIWNPKDCIQDKIEDIICGEGVGFMIRYREDTL